MSASTLIEHFFRHEYSRLVAVLTRRLGVQHLEAVEDGVQVALMRALDHWVRDGVPDNPSAWVFRVAQRAVVGELRQAAGRRTILERAGTSADAAATEPPHPHEAQTDLLRMLFVCCDDAIAVESQLVLALKVLCGFSVREIALRLFATEANVYKRLSRARQYLRQCPPGWHDRDEVVVPSRIPSVHKIVYLLFTEGYLSSSAEQAIRQELCDEAVRLATLLAERRAESHSETCALLALMLLHAAREHGRVDPEHGLLLLEEQDRSQWDHDRIAQGLAWLERSAEGTQLTRYHLEAAIAAEHCLAPSYAETRWDRVVENYELLERITPSPMHRLNRAVAVTEWRGGSEGLSLLKGGESLTEISGTYGFAAVMAYVSLRAGEVDQADHYRAAAVERAPSHAIRQLLLRRLSGPTG